jgi:hypothetical protein
VRRFLCIFLMLLLPLHSFAVQDGAFALEKAFDIAHELDHLEGVSHHHDEHGTHYDDSGESAKHFAEHSASQPCVALPSIAVPIPANEPLVAARGDLGNYIPNPIPERPQRPPQSLG